ncbi:MAG: hypothetical protein Q7T55_19185, partial [Solirubrobacteraceae bacterium]|nr:hypothetical protein [Solirubrobacteraceae bacterium]
RRPAGVESSAGCVGHREIARERTSRPGGAAPAAMFATFAIGHLTGRDAGRFDGVATLGLGPSGSGGAGSHPGGGALGGRRPL